MTTPLTYAQRLERTRLLLTTLVGHDGLDGERAEGWAPWNTTALETLLGGRLAHTMDALSAAARAAVRRILAEDPTITTHALARARRCVVYAAAADWITAAADREHVGEHEAARLLLEDVERALSFHHEALFPHLALLPWETTQVRAGVLRHLIRPAFYVTAFAERSTLAFIEQWAERAEGGFLYGGEAKSTFAPMPRAAVRLYGRVSRIWGTTLTTLGDEVLRGAGVPEGVEGFARLFRDIAYENTLERRFRAVWNHHHGTAESNPPVIVIAFTPIVRGP